MEAWKKAIETELSRAQAARQRGNEGQARVCARRAAGMAIREHLERLGRKAPSRSAMDLLRMLDQDPASSGEVRELIAHLSTTVDESFKLPVEADLIEDAQRLCRLLLPDWESGTNA